MLSIFNGLRKLIRRYVQKASFDEGTPKPLLLGFVLRFVHCSTLRLLFEGEFQVLSGLRDVSLIALYRKYV